MAQVAVQFLLNGPKEPFFLDVGFHETHRVFPEVSVRDGQNVLLPPPLPDTPATRRDMAAFHASARQLDASMGRVLDALEPPAWRKTPSSSAPPTTASPSRA